MTAPATAPTFLEHALTYAARGWHVLPCAPRDKRPDGRLVPNGLKQATTDPDMIRSWWAQSPDANIAVVTGAEASGFVVVDVDGHKSGEESLELLEAVHGRLPETVRGITGGDGWHYLFRHPGGHFGNTVNRLGQGLDTRGDGGYIVVPPSIHPDTGRRYEWADDPDGELAELPAWVIDAVRAPRQAPSTAPTSHSPGPTSPSTTRYAAKVLDERAAEVASAGKGTRNDTLNRAAFRLGQLVAGGQIPKTDVLDRLTAAARAVGLDDREISRTIDSGIQTGERDPQYPDPSRGNLRVVGEHEQPADTRAGEERPEGSREGILADGFRDSDSGNADRFVGAADGHARYVHAWGRWVVYDERGVWKIDTGDAMVTELAKRVARRMFVRAAQLGGDDKLWKWAKRSESSNAIASMVRLARGIPGVLVDHTELDAKPYLLNVANGTVDLRTGTLRPHDPDDLLTVQAPTIYDETAQAPLWAACLDRWQPDPDMRSYLQEIAGSGAVGRPVEHLFVNLGPGGNGKSKFYGAIAHVLGDYVVVPHKSLLTVQKHEQHDTVKARLFGARLAIASETDTNDRLDEAKVKELTGGDMLEARRMREDLWKFRQTHTMVMHTNHRPQVRGVDEGIWRRIRLLPWDVTIPMHERDDHLADKLAAEASGILNWILDGARRWQHDGFREPSSVASATAGYRSSQDALAGFLEEWTVPVERHRASVKELVKVYEEWCESTGEPAVTTQTFGRMLGERGFALTRDRRYRIGLRVVEPGETPAEDPPPCPTCGRPAATHGHEGWYCDHCMSVFLENARLVPLPQIPTYAGARREVTGDTAHTAHDPDTPHLAGTHDTPTNPDEEYL